MKGFIIRSIIATIVITTTAASLFFLILGHPNPALTLATFLNVPLLVFGIPLANFIEDTEPERCEP